MQRQITRKQPFQAPKRARKKAVLFAENRSYKLCEQDYCGALTRSRNENRIYRLEILFFRNKGIFRQ